MEVTKKRAKTIIENIKTYWNLILAVVVFRCIYYNICTLTLIYNKIENNKNN